MLEAERARRIRKQTGNVQVWIAFLVAGIIIGIVVWAMVSQSQTGKRIDNACLNTDPMYGCSINNP